ncbi:hypothetical protein C8R43DRAFT_300430 [Mycena crocata]|nr:hypothetical protein C8R43DRAFT_300430 [Mycena crocata]
MWRCVTAAIAAPAVLDLQRQMRASLRSLTMLSKSARVVTMKLHARANRPHRLNFLLQSALIPDRTCVPRNRRQIPRIRRVKNRREDDLVLRRAIFADPAVLLRAHAQCPHPSVLARANEIHALNATWLGKEASSGPDGPCVFCAWYAHTVPRR